MKLWVISQLERSWSTDAVVAAARSRGHDTVLVHPRHYHLAVGGEHPVLLDERGVAALPERVFTRMGSAAPPDALALIRWLEQRGVRCTNGAEALELSRSKLRTAERLQRAGLPIPRTVLLSPRIPLAQAVELCGGPPWIIKLPVSTHGEGVVLVERSSSLRSMVEFLSKAQHPVLLQEFIAEAAGSDLRLFVVGSEVMASMRRRSSQGEFRSNLHAGGSAEPFSPDGELQALAVKAAKALGLEVAGVDILESSRGPLILEVNGSPGFEGLQKVTPAPLADRLIEYLER